MPRNILFKKDILKSFSVNGRLTHITKGNSPSIPKFTRGIYLTLQSRNQSAIQQLEQYNRSDLYARHPFSSLHFYTRKSGVGGATNWCNQTVCANCAYIDGWDGDKCTCGCNTSSGSGCGPC